MKKILLSVVIVAALAFIASAAVVDLTPDNFDEHVKGTKFAFVEFYAPWCGHCKALAPDYEKFGQAFEGKPDVVIAKLDADVHKELASKYGVTGYPTLKFFVDGTPEDYNGGRSLEDLIQYVNSKVPSASRARVPPPPRSFVTVLTPENFDRIVEDPTKDVYVEFYAPWCGHCKRLAPIWDQLSEIFREDKDVVIAKLDADAHKEFATKYGITGFPTIKLFPKKAGEIIAYTGGRDLIDFVEHVNTMSGTLRGTNGRLIRRAGVIPKLADLAKQVMEGDESVMGEIDTIIAAHTLPPTSEHAALYKRFLEKQLKDNKYIQKEAARLTRMLEGNLSPKKTDEFTIRLNILNSIINGHTPGVMRQEL